MDSGYATTGGWLGASGGKKFAKNQEKEGNTGKKRTNQKEKAKIGKVLLFLPPWQIGLATLLHTDKVRYSKQKPAIAVRKNVFQPGIRKSEWWQKQSIDIIIGEFMFNPNTFAGLVGKVRKKLSPEGGRKGGWRKKACAARPPDPGLEPGTCRVLGEGTQLHARGAV